ncbi:MAG: serine/threonine-protein phosphatase [Ktedonobacteraceae bacterium]|nr:serine/threonine-protein phosphatase [Ktedonobacteraceae bacterium]MBV9709562.1 serine/threonine-protein phosphatase [Ktedonobacteraceae bacterium]
MPRHKTTIRRRTHTSKSNHVLTLAPFTYARRSIACERHPLRNEDSILVDESTGLAAVFDGVGGSAAGEIASQTAARATYQAWRHFLQHHQKGRKIHTFLDQCDTHELCTLLQHLIREADERVRTEGARQAGTDDLATTVAMATFCRQPESKNYTMVFAHVGDSRIYLLREKETIKRLTNDDGLLAKLVENQIISSEDALRIDQAMRADQLSDTEFSYFRLRGGITQALGGPLPPTVHTDQITVYPGDRILLCTDGIHDNLVDEEIEQILRTSPRTSSARMLVEQALHRSHQERHMTVRAKPDDMSAIILTYHF